MTRAYENEYVDRNAPNPGIAAVLSVLMPGLGQVYCGRLFPDPGPGLPRPRALRLVRLRERARLGRLLTRIRGARAIAP